VAEVCQEKSLRDGSFLIMVPPVTDEPTIRKALTAACAERGVQAEISKAFNVSQSTVKRWLDGGEIPPPMLKLLDWYFFGTLPPRLVSDPDLPIGALEFSPDEWRIVLCLASRAGQTPAKWIASTIRFHLDMEASRESPGNSTGTAGH
jgi:DNA-binding MarR family transcriptional regulator